MSLFETGPAEADLGDLCHWATLLDIPQHRLWFTLPARDAPSTTTSEAPATTESRETATAFVRRVTVSAVHELTFDQIDNDIARLVAEFIVGPLSEIRTEIHELQSDVFKLIEGNRFPDQLRRLYLAASRLCGLEGHACRDVGAYGAAARQAEAAWLCAELAGHQPMLAWLRALQSLIAYGDGRLTSAISLARDGLTHKPAGSLAFRLAKLEACACAAAGDPEASEAPGIAVVASETSSEVYDDFDLFAFPIAELASLVGGVADDGQPASLALGPAYLVRGDLEDARRVALTRDP